MSYKLFHGNDLWSIFFNCATWYFSKYGAVILADYELYIHEDHDDDKPCLCNT